MSIKSLVPDSVTRWAVRGATLLVVALWLTLTYIVMCRPPLVMLLAAMALLVVAWSDLWTALRRRP